MPIAARTDLTLPLEATPLHQAIERLRAMSFTDAATLDFIRRAPDYLLWHFIRDNEVDLDGTIGAPLVPHLVTRAQDDARAEGVHWTPVLDLLYTREIWADDGTPGVLSPTAMANGLAASLRTASPRELETLLDVFHAAPVHTVVAAHAPCLTGAMVERLLTHKRLALAIARHPALDADARDRLAEWLPEALAGVTRSAASSPGGAEESRLLEESYTVLAESPEGFPEAGHRALVRTVEDDLQRRNMRPPNHFLSRALLASPRTDPAVLREMARARHLRTAEDWAHWICHPALTPDTVVELTRQGAPLSNALVAIHTTTTLTPRADTWEALVRLLLAHPSEHRFLPLVLSSRHTTLQQARTIAHTALGSAVRVALATHTRWTSDAEIRDALKASRHPEVLWGLLESSPANEFGYWLRRLSVVSPASTATYLEERGVPEGATLRDTDMLPILTAGSVVAPKVAGIMRAMAIAQPKAESRPKPSPKRRR